MVGSMGHMGYQCWAVLVTGSVGRWALWMMESGWWGLQVIGSMDSVVNR